KNIKDWDDLVRDDVEVITPNPKTSGGARWNYLAAWGYALKQNGGDEEKAYEFVRKLLANVPVLDPGARGATNTFVQRGLGDVFIAWENEAYLSVEQLGKGEFEIVVPSVSILAEPPVTVVDKNVDRKGTREVAEAYLQYLYSEEAQRIAARNYYRPSTPEIAREFGDEFDARGKVDSNLESLTKRWGAGTRLPQELGSRVHQLFDGCDAGRQRPGSFRGAHGYCHQTPLGHTRFRADHGLQPSVSGFHS